MKFEPVFRPHLTARKKTYTFRVFYIYKERYSNYRACFLFQSVTKLVAGAKFKPR